MWRSFHLNVYSEMYPKVIFHVAYQESPQIAIYKWNKFGWGIFEIIRFFCELGCVLIVNWQFYLQSLNKVGKNFSKKKNNG